MNKPYNLQGMIPTYMNATVEQHSYTLLADINTRTESLEDFADETIGRVRSLYKYLESIELRLDEQSARMQQLEGDLDNGYTEINRLDHNSDYLYRRIRLLLTFCKRTKSRVLRKIKKFKQTDEGKIALIE